MAPSQSTACFIAAQTQPIEKNVDELKELRSNGKWAVLITIMSFLYGEYTVARMLPRDARQKDWWMMQNPLPTVLITFAYIYFVTCWGPKYMKDRKPISGLRPLMMFYNAFQVVFSAWLFYEGSAAGWLTHYKFICQPCDFSMNPSAVRMMHCAYWYYFSKFVDFIDTLFFVAHKKHEHISLLHVSHHALMPISVWYGAMYQPGGHSTLMGLLNSFVHTVMYAYYLLAAMGPRVRPFLWWKKYLTTLQLLQFTVVFFHAALLAFIDCAIPKILVAWVSGVAVMFFVLFTDFYIKAYRKRGKKQNADRLKSLNAALSNGTNGVSNGVGNGVSNGVGNGVVGNGTSPSTSTAENDGNMVLRSRKE